MKKLLKSTKIMMRRSNSQHVFHRFTILLICFCVCVVLVSDCKLNNDHSLQRRDSAYRSTFQQYFSIYGRLPVLASDAREIGVNEGYQAALFRSEYQVDTGNMHVVIIDTRSSDTITSFSKEYLYCGMVGAVFDGLKTEGDSLMLDALEDGLNLSKAYHSSRINNPQKRSCGLVLQLVPGQNAPKMLCSYCDRNTNIEVVEVIAAIQQSSTSDHTLTMGIVIVPSWIPRH